MSFYRCFRRFSSAPLDHIKVLDLSRIVAGPFCTMILADYGATVYKVESPGVGDETRLWPPHVNYSKEEMTCYFGALNRNKKSICVNFKSTEGIRILHDLARKCDVLVENFVPGKLDELGLGYDSIKKVAPHIVYCSITGFGPKGPYKDRMGYDIIAASMGGLFHITGPKDGDPCKTGVAMTDLSTGLYAHGAIMAALLQRLKTGKGQKVDCNLLSTQVACLINIGSNYLNAGKEAVRWGTEHESIVILQSFKTKDGYMTIGTGSDSQFKNFCLRFNLDLYENEKFKTNANRVQNRDGLNRILDPMFLKMKNDEILKILEGAPFPFGPVNTIKQEVRTVKVTLKKQKTDKQVKWTSETVDNEHMNKKKSKCCCIYEKPRNFGESSSEDEGECENCFGHVELKKKNQPSSPEPDPEQPSPDPPGTPFPH